MLLNCKICQRLTKTDEPHVYSGKNAYLRGFCRNCGAKKSLKLDLSQMQRGEGLLSFAKRVISAIRGPRKDIPPEARKTLEKYKDAKILHLEAYRTPLSPIINSVINLVKTRPYDTLYHLFLVVETDKGDLLLEKNEVINFRELRSTDIKENSESEEIPVSKDITVGQFIENGKAKLGANFARYSATGANCQDFLIGLLQGSGIGKQSNYAWIKQDTKDLVPEFWERAADTITDLAARVDILKQGEGSSEIHAVEISKVYYPKSKMLSWLKKHNFETARIESKRNTFWANQTPKSRYASFAKKQIKPGINLVLGFKPSK